MSARQSGGRSMSAAQNADIARHGTRARRRFERVTGIDTRGVDKRVARRIMRRYSWAYLAQVIERNRRNRPAQLANACACGDCFHPAFGPNTDGDPCDWCRDCGCASADHEPRYRSAEGGGDRG